MKLTDAQAFCLAHLANCGGQSKLALVKMCREDCGADSFDLGQALAAIFGLFEHGLVSTHEHRPLAMQYRITDTGRQALRDHREGEG